MVEVFKWLMYILAPLILAALLLGVILLIIVCGVAGYKTGRRPPS